MYMPILTISEVNTLISEHFIKIFGNVVEHNSAVSIGLLKFRPFANALDIYYAVEAYLDALNIKDKEHILMDYPDLVARLSDLSRMILEFDKNHNIAGVDKLTIQEKQQLKQINNGYKQKFGFNFVIFGKESKVSTIFSEMENRIQNNKNDEINIAINEVKKICKDRILEIVH